MRVRLSASHRPNAWAGYELWNKNIIFYSFNTALTLPTLPPFLTEVAYAQFPHSLPDRPRLAWLTGGSLAKPLATHLAQQRPRRTGRLADPATRGLGCPAQRCDCC